MHGNVNPALAVTTSGNFRDICQIIGCSTCFLVGKVNQQRRENSALAMVSCPLSVVCRPFFVFGHLSGIRLSERDVEIDKPASLNLATCARSAAGSALNCSMISVALISRVYTHKRDSSNRVFPLFRSSPDAPRSVPSNA